MEPTSTSSPEIATDRDARDETVGDLLDAVKSEHPALQRLAARRREGIAVEASITSYDRMHHRHNRT